MPDESAAVPPPDDQAALDALFADAPDARDPAAWVDEPPPPEWAREMAAKFYDIPLVPTLDSKTAMDIRCLARLLASVREGALREAAVRCAAHRRLRAAWARWTHGATSESP